MGPPEGAAARNPANLSQRLLMVVIRCHLRTPGCGIQVPVDVFERDRRGTSSAGEGARWQPGARASRLMPSAACPSVLTRRCPIALVGWAFTAVMTRSLHGARYPGLAANHLPRFDLR
jgi:hypothetical protein